MEREEEIPLCPSCNHRHIQGVKCHICGHVGRSQIYSKMKAKANILRSFKFEVFDSTNLNSYVYGLWEVCTELRNMIYCNEMMIPGEQEFDQLEQSSRHFIGILGDAPISIARWRFLSSDSSSVYAIIDRCGVLQYYRQKGFGRKTLDAVVSDIRNIATTQSIDLKGIYIQVLEEEWMITKLVSLGVKPQNFPVEMRGGKSFVTLMWDGIA
mmetsp:Transcript_16532/g.16642  ORF Transcript_16532/g.16642 Transcript_16532/m.16642 type:complete len:211 (+) Transcript_16532:387-1019(+)